MSEEKTTAEETETEEEVNEPDPGGIIVEEKGPLFKEVTDKIGDLTKMTKKKQILRGLGLGLCPYFGHFLQKPTEKTKDLFVKHLDLYIETFNGLEEDFQSKPT